MIIIVFLKSIITSVTLSHVSPFSLSRSLYYPYRLRSNTHVLPVYIILRNIYMYICLYVRMRVVYINLYIYIFIYI